MKTKIKTSLAGAIVANAGVTIAGAQDVDSRGLGPTGGGGFAFLGPVLCMLSVGIVFAAPLSGVGTVLNGPAYMKFPERLTRLVFSCIPALATLAIAHYANIAIFFAAPIVMGVIVGGGILLCLGFIIVAKIRKP